MSITHGWITAEPDDPTKDVSQRNLNDHFGNGLGFYSVMDYGATGDGTTDDTGAIATAIAAMTSGGTLFFPRGTYKTSGGFTISQPTTIAGEGSGGVYDAAAFNISLVTCTSTTAVLFTVTAEIARFENIALRNDASAAVTAGAGILVDGTVEFQRVDYEDVVVSDFYIGINVNNGSHWTMRSCTIFGPVQYCLRITNVSNPDEGDFAISDCWFQSVTAGVPAAIRIEGAGGGHISNSRINGYDQGFVQGIDLFVLDTSQTGELFLSQVMIVGFAEAGVRARYEGDLGIWTKIVLSGCFIATYNATTTSRAVDIEGREFGVGGLFVNVVVNGCSFFASAGSARAAVRVANTILSWVGSSLVDGTYFTTLLEEALYTADIMDGSGAIGNGVQLDGTPSAGGSVAVATTATNAIWLFPSWLARASYYDTIRRTPGLIGYWRLGEPSGTTANDSGANNLDGTYINTPTLAATGALTGDSNTAVTFASASTEFVDLGTDAELSMDTELSIEAWLKTTATTGTLFGRVYGDSALPAGEELIGYRMSMNGTAISLFCGDGTNTILISSPGAVNDGAYHHVVVTRKGARGRIYVDGVAVYDNAEIVGDVGSMSGTRRAFIAAWPYYGDRIDFADGYLNGTLDEVAVYDRELDPVEVLMHYEIGTDT